MKNRKFPWWLVILLVVLAIVLVICTAGLLAPKLNDENHEKINDEEEERLKELERQNQLESLKTELQNVNQRIVVVEAKLKQIKVQERKILFYSRLTVGAIIIGLDCIFFKYYPISDYLGELLKFNSAIVACYSFVAFISHGTPAKFAVYLKSKIRAILEYYHRTTYNEYDTLISNRSILTEIIPSLEQPIVKDQASLPKIAS